MFIFVYYFIYLILFLFQIKKERMDKESDGGEAHLDFGKMVEFSDFGKEEDKASAKTRHLIRTLKKYSNLTSPSV